MTTVYLIAVGFISIFGQVVILRELVVAFYGIELVYILALGFWLLGTAAGATAGRRSVLPRETSVQDLLLLNSAALLGDVIFIRGMRRIFGGVPGAYLPIDVQLAGLLVTVVPVSFLAGLLFRWAARRLFYDGRTLAEAYWLESAGGVVGGLLSTLLIALGFQNLSAVFFCCVVSFAAVLVCASKKRYRLRMIVSQAGLVTIFVLVLFSYRIDVLMTSWNHPHLVESRDTPYGRVTVTVREDQVIVYDNDAVAYETQTTAAEELVHLSTLQNTGPRNVLVLGGGFAGIISELLKLPVERIDYVEINGTIVGTLVRRLPPDQVAALRDEKVNIIYDDPRRYLGTHHLYDVILVAMPEPRSAQNNRFFTEEFFKQCSSNLKKGGIVAFSIASAENFWSPELLRRNGSIYAAVKSVFANVLVIPGATDIFIGSGSALTHEPHILIDRFRQRDISTRLVTPRYIDYLFTNDRFASVNELLALSRQPPNSDILPACYSHTVSIWLSRFFPALTFPELQSRDIWSIVCSPVFWLLAVIAVAAAFHRKLAGVRKFLLMFTAGSVGMVCETLLLLYFQNESGVLYQDIGMLLMTFMIGLTLGAFAVDRFMMKIRKKRLRTRWMGAGMFAAFGILNFCVYYGIESHMLTGITLTSLMLTIDGMIVSAVFAFIAVSGDTGEKHFMPWLYSADLAGGSVGSVIAVLFLIPVFGMLNTSLLGAAAAIFATVFLK